MRLKDLKNIDIDDFYWNFVFGKSKLKATILDLRKNNFEQLPSPVFFLSTGRCGTNWFTEFFSLSKEVKSFHEPKPNLGIQGKLAYEIYTKNNFKLTTNEAKLIEEVFLAGREQILRYSYKSGKRIIETNNQITFFAPALLKLFPQAMFVHLNRHPGEFVRSAMRRNFYQNNIEDLKRITPCLGSEAQKDWGKMSQLQKSTWLWKETNLFIESVKEIRPEQFIYFDFNKLDVGTLLDLLKKLNLQIPEHKINKLIGKRKNTQKSGTFATYADWTDKDKSVFKTICGDLATEYGYQI